MLEEVTEAAEILVGKLESSEIAKIRSTLGDKRMLNRVFDLFGATYPDWPSTAEGKLVASGKRKRGSSGPAAESTGRHGRGSKRVRRAGSVASSRAGGLRPWLLLWWRTRYRLVRLSCWPGDGDHDYSADEADRDTSLAESEGSSSEGGGV